MTEQDLNDVIADFREALRDYVKGDPEPAMSFFSEWDDVTLANPLEPPRRGPAEVGEAARRAAANFQAGGSLQGGERCDTLAGSQSGSHPPHFPADSHGRPRTPTATIAHVARSEPT